MLSGMSKPEIQESQVRSLAVLQALLPWRQQLATGFGTTHGNASLTLIDGMMVMLAAFYNPVVRSQRLLEALSEQSWMHEKVAIKRIPRSTFSDALKRFDPAVLKPLITQLAKRVPGLVTRDPDLADITRRIVAADGSYFTLAGEVLWALRHRAGGRTVSSVRLNLQLDVETFVPVAADISGREEGSETKAFQRQLQEGVIYLVDRNFTNWGFLQAVLDARSNFVVRLRKDVLFGVQAPRPLTAKDAQAGVRTDDLGHLTGPQSKGNEGRPCRQGQAPRQTLRRVVVWDDVNRKDVILLTDLLDVPAYVIALLYRQRWQIELFLRWLKCWAGLEHLISKSPQGITFQFYVAVIATLLLHIATGYKVSKYALFWLNAVATGQATFEQMQQGLARIEREKALARARLARKKAAAAAALAPAALPA
jgi:hypothetical protein